MASVVDELLELIAKYLRGVDEKHAGIASELSAHSTGMRYLTQLNQKLVKEIEVVARQITGEKLPRHIAEGLQSSRVSVRNAASDALYALVTNKLFKDYPPFDPDAIRAATREHGAEVLLLFPIFADHYRRHISSVGEGAESLAADFATYLQRSSNKQLQHNARAFLSDDIAKRLFRASDDVVFSAGNHALRTSAAERQAAVDALGEVFAKVPEELFFSVFFAKTPHLIPPGGEKAIRSELRDILTGRTLLPSDLRHANAGGKLFLFADRSGLQGMLGELLILPKQLERASEVAAKEGKPVFLLVGARLNSKRTLASGADAKQLKKGPRTADVPDKVKGGKHILEVSAEAVEKESKNKEFTDGLIGVLDGKGGFAARVWTECKVGRNGVKEGLEQFDRNHEDIDELLELHHQSRGAYRSAVESG